MFMTCFELALFGDGISPALKFHISGENVGNVEGEINSENDISSPGPLTLVN